MSTYQDWKAVENLKRRGDTNSVVDLLQKKDSAEKKERKENASHLVSILYPGIIKKKTKKVLSLFEVDGSHTQDGASGPV